jgi:capsular exopolysaccharide synthesis family protein
MNDMEPKSVMSAGRALHVVAPEFTARPAEAMDDEGGGFSLHLSDVRAMAMRQRYLIGAVILLALVVGLIVTLLITPIYQATTSIQIDQATSKIIEGQDVAPTSSLMDSARTLQTQVDILKSRTLATKVANKLRLASSDDFLVGMQLRPAGADLSREEREKLRHDKVVSTLQENLDVALPLSSRIAQIKFSSPDPELAARIANAYAETYITGNIESRFEATAYAREFLEQELGRAKQRLEESERYAIDYARNTQLIDASDGGGGGDSEGGGSRSLTTASLVKLNDDLAAARTLRIQSEQRWLQAEKTPVMSLPEVLENSSVQSLQSERVKQQAAYQELRQRYQPDHPQAQQLAANIASIDKQAVRIAGDVRNSIRERYQVALRQEESMAAGVERLKSEALAEQQRRVRLDILKREADTNHTLYNGLLQRYKEVSAAAGITSNNVSIVDKAEVPATPIAPKPLLNMAIAGFGGLALAIFLAFGRETFDDSLRSPDDVQRKLQMTLLGTTPVVKSDMTPREMLADPRSALSEAYYSIRVALEFSTAHGVPASIVVTSSKPSEGKSTTASALAEDFARIGRKTLLVDGDLRLPSLHRYLNVQNNAGFVSVMTGQVPLEKAIQRIEGTTLDFLSCGPIPPNPAQLLSGDAVRNFISEHSANYDLIVIDGPPIMGLADAPQLARATAGVVVVVEAGRAHRGQAKTAIKRLREARANILGVVLTKFDTKRVGYGDDYGYSYSYNYGKKQQD